jgi:small-conductance mechanosensitive channel
MMKTNNSEPKMTRAEFDAIIKLEAEAKQAKRQVRADKKAKKLKKAKRKAKADKKAKKLKKAERMVRKIRRDLREAKLKVKALAGATTPKHEEIEATPEEIEATPEPKKNSKGKKAGAKEAKANKNK